MMAEAKQALCIYRLTFHQIILMASKPIYNFFFFYHNRPQRVELASNKGKTVSHQTEKQTWLQHKTNIHVTHN